MGEEKKDNPGHITPDLCEAYRGHLETKIDGITNSLKTAIYLTGLILSIVVSAWSIFQLLMG